jgi:hypothetical protein
MLNPMPKRDGFIGSGEACRYLKVNPATISRWVKTGDLVPATKLPGKNGAFVFYRADIEAIARERATL